MIWCSVRAASRVEGRQKPGKEPVMTEHSDDDLRRAWDIYRFAEETVPQRMNYGMVAQSMLLLGLITLFAYQYQIPGYSVVAEWVIGLLGLILSIFQYVKITDLANALRLCKTTI